MKIEIIDRVPGLTGLSVGSMGSYAVYIIAVRRTSRGCRVLLRQKMIETSKRRPYQIDCGFYQTLEEAKEVATDLAKAIGNFVIYKTREVGD
ncbi:MAG: hypothetical protein V3U92_19500 [Cellulophaga sp.]